MINLIKTTKCVILLQDFAPTSTSASKYAIKADSIAAQKVLKHITDKKELNETPKFLEPTNIRIVGHYETLDEAKFILRKLRKSVKHDEIAKNKSSDATIIIDTTSYNKDEHSFTPRYTNGISNVTHHIKELNGNTDNSFIRMLDTNTDSLLTFREWALQNEIK